MRILLTGAAGMLGSAVVPELVKGEHTLAVTDLDVSVPRLWGDEGPTVCALDVRDAEAVDDAFAAVQPELVLHLAAETSLEVCEMQPANAFATNTLGTKNVALACQRADVPMVYISTAGVFDGVKEEPYNEFDPPNPINTYGLSKLRGEEIVQTLLDRYYVVRAGWMVGGGRAKDHKFVSLILQQLDEGATVLRAVSDKLGTPTYAPDFARCLHQLVLSDSYGLYHMSGEGSGTRYDVAQHMLSVLGRDDVTLLEVPSSYFDADFFAARPTSEVMANFVLEQQGMNTMRDWRVALEEYLYTQFADRIVAPGLVASR